MINWHLATSSRLPVRSSYCRWPMKFMTKYRQAQLTTKVSTRNIKPIRIRRFKEGRPGIVTSRAVASGDGVGGWDRPPLMAPTTSGTTTNSSRAATTPTTMRTVRFDDAAGGCGTGRGCR